MTPDPTSRLSHSAVQPAPLLLDSRQAAETLSVSQRTLWGLDIPRIRVGRRGVRYAVVDLKNFIDRSREIPESIQAEPANCGD